MNEISYWIKISFRWNWLRCAECKELIPPEDEAILGEVPFHKSCCENWCNKFIEAIKEK